MQNCFIPIAGADEIGASSYYMEVDGVKIIFDAGARNHSTIMYPDYNVLLNGTINDFNQIDIIVLSHAHFDHIGSLFHLATKATNTKIFATKITKELTRLQLIDLERSLKNNLNEKMRLMKLQQVEKVIDRIIEMPVKQPFDLETCRLTFYPAGHMAGACMTAIETTNHKVLYTGDFSFNTVMEMNNLNICGFRPDILIMNATYGYSMKETKGFDYKALEKRIEYGLTAGNNVLLKSNSIAKHLDLFYAIKMMKHKYRYYLHQSSELIAEALSLLRYDVYSNNLILGNNEKEVPHVIISKEELQGYVTIDVDRYSLHASINDLIAMIYMCMPAKVFTVHTICYEGMNFIDIIENQARFHGEIIQCINEMIYIFD